MASKIPTSFFYADSNVCPSAPPGSDCEKNATKATQYTSLVDSLSAQKNKTADMQTLYGRELAYTINMIIGCVGLGLYIKWNQ